MLCGSSTNGGLNGDADCAGEEKCCLDSDTGCFQVCTLPPNGKSILKTRSFSNSLQPLFQSESKSKVFVLIIGFHLY